MYTVICGGGKLGELLTKKLKKDGHQVCIIDKNSTVCARLAEDLKDVLIICGDATSLNVLREAQLEKAEVCVSLTSHDEDNIITSYLAKKKFNVKRTVARVNDPKHTGIYSYYSEVDIPIDSTSIVAKVVEEEASFLDIMELLSFQKGRLSFIRIDVGDNAPVVNKMIKDLTLPPNSVLIAILRGSEIIVPSGLTEIKSGDEIIAVTLIENEKELFKALLGEL